MYLAKRDEQQSIKKKRKNTTLMCDSLVNWLLFLLKKIRRFYKWKIMKEVLDFQTSAV